ncbi:MAG: hypothetical protein GC171_00040 [Terrimonas sp.]|nr:hypothetical protein [Terrimonas sp.]
MKRVMNNYKVMAMALMIILTLGFTQNVNATGQNEKPVGLKYVGKLKNLPVFQLDINGAPGAEYIIRISDDANMVIYSEKVKGENISRKFQLNDEVLGNAYLTFEVVKKDDNTVTSYKVSNNTRTIQDIEIAKL